MGEAQLHPVSAELVIRSIICLYGSEASAALADRFAANIALHWNEPVFSVTIGGLNYRVRFDITGMYDASLRPEAVWYNDDPKLNFFRVEQYASGNISFVDGIGSNTGYMKLANLLQTSTTAAHEYGHTIGLVHPAVLDIRGGKPPGIMYPRGTWCDSHLQYDPTARAGEHGGFLDPKFRKVTVQDITALRLHKLPFDQHGTATLGEFTSLYHERHTETSE